MTHDPTRPEPDRTSRRRIGTMIVAAFALWAGACAGDGATAPGDGLDLAGPEVSDDPVGVGDPADVETPEELAFTALDEPTRSLVDLEARYQCDVTRFAFGDIADIEQLRTDLLADAGVDPADYDAFQDRVATDPDLARIIAARSAACAGDGGSGAIGF